MIYNALIDTPLSKQSLHWTYSALECYNRGCVCDGCYYKKTYDFDCKMKRIVIALIKKEGAPTPKQLSILLDGCKTRNPKSVQVLIDRTLQQRLQHNTWDGFVYNNQYISKVCIDFYVNTKHIKEFGRDDVVDICLELNTKWNVIHDYLRYKRMIIDKVRNKKDSDGKTIGVYRFKEGFVKGIEKYLSKKEVINELR